MCVAMGMSMAVLMTVAVIVLSFGSIIVTRDRMSMRMGQTAVVIVGRRRMLMTVIMIGSIFSAGRLRLFMVRVTMRVIVRVVMMFF